MKRGDGTAFPQPSSWPRTRRTCAGTLEIAERTEVPVTPRAGGTGRTGGAVPVAGGIVLATDKMKQVKENQREGPVGGGGSRASSR